MSQTVVPRSEWQPRLLAKLRSGGRFAVAVDLSGTTVKTVRRHIVNDRAKLGADHPEALGVLIREAKAAWRQSERERRRKMARRRLARAIEARADQQSERGRSGAVARWAR